MTFDDFKNVLKSEGMTIKRFAEMCGLNPNSLSTTWKAKGEVPKWAESWLENFRKAKKLDSVKKTICDDDSK